MKLPEEEKSELRFYIAYHSSELLRKKVTIARESDAKCLFFYSIAETR